MRFTPTLWMLLQLISFAWWFASMSLVGTQLPPGSSPDPSAERSPCEACLAGVTNSGTRFCAGELSSRSHSDVLMGRCKTVLAEKLNETTSQQCFTSAVACPGLRLGPKSFTVPPVDPGAKRQRATHPGPLVAPQQKIILCFQYKGGSRNLLQLLRRLCGINRSQSDSELDGIPRLRDFSYLDQIAMMLDPKWVKALFVRDPLERLLSGYLNKCGGYKGMDEKQLNLYCGSKELRRNFTEFVRLVVSLKHNNGHFAPQHIACNLAAWLPWYQFQGNVANLTAHTNFLLQELGLAAYGAINTSSEHSTFAIKHLSKRYTNETANLALDFYTKDYTIFGLPRPTFTW